jgi:hypothetical protein
MGVWIGESVELDESRMSELHMLIKQGKSAEQIAKIMKVDVKTIKELMKESVEVDEAKDFRRELEKRHAEAIKIIWAIDTTFGRTKWTDSFGNYVTKNMPDDIDTSIDAGWSYHQNRGRGEWFFTIEPRDVVKYSYTGNAKINSSEKSGRLKIGEFEKFISTVWALTKAKNESVELDEAKESDFKVGDNVTVADKSHKLNGQSGKVTKVASKIATVKMDKGGKTIIFKTISLWQDK